jgi:hypothetical protein
MKLLSSLASVASLSLGLLAPPCNGEPAERSLFDGKSIAGWEHVGPGDFTVEHGLLHARGGMGMLWYTGGPIFDSVIHVVYRLDSPTADSGVFIRIPEPPREVWAPINTGYEVEIGEWPTEYARTGVLYSFSKALTHASKPMGEWNTLEITIDGPHTTVMLNGQKVTDYVEGQPVPRRTGEHGEPKAGPRPNGGYIGLQNHDGTAVYFKEISVRPLHAGPDRH